jgi:hypothetical protein
MLRLKKRAPRKFTVELTLDQINALVVAEPEINLRCSLKGVRMFCEGCGVTRNALGGFCHKRPCIVADYWDAVAVLARLLPENAESLPAKRGLR